MGKSITGRVVSDKADKTIVLVVTERKTHPIYKKQFSRNVKHIAHDEKNEAKVGDIVTVTETRPISARKRMKLVSINEKAAITADSNVEAVTAADEGSEIAIQEKKAVEKEEKAAEEETTS